MAATLGEVLYADKAQSVVSEEDWTALVQSIAGGDQGALQELYRRAHRIVYTLVARIVNNREAAEELTLDVFHGVWRRAGTYDPANGTVVGWIMNQARSRAIDRVRLEQRKKRVNPYPEQPDAGVVATGPQETFESWQRGYHLRTALAVLTPEERAAIETAFFSELTHTEAAARLNVPLGTVKTRIRSGLKKLHQSLADKL